MRYIGTEYDGKRMKAVPVDRGSHIGEFVYDLNPENVDALLDIIDEQRNRLDKIAVELDIAIRKLDLLQNPDAPVTGGPWDDYNHNEKRRGGHGD